MYTHTISDEEMSSFVIGLKSRYGVDFSDYEQSNIKRQLGKMMKAKGMQSMFSFWGAILRDRKLGEKCIEKVLQKDASFFRNPEMWTIFHDQILPKFSSKPQINVWHAGCSSGKEVYSSAIVFAECKMYDQVRILGTDISREALALAEAGSYSRLLWNQFLKNYRIYNPNGQPTDHFNVGTYNTIKKELKQNISYQRHDLVQDDINQKFDVIFCRYVLTSFNQERKVKIIKLLTDQLDENGFIILGYEDNLPEEVFEYIEVFDQKTHIYRLKS